MRGIERTYGVCRHTLSAWLKKAEQLPPLETTLQPVDPGQTPVLEVDELWSFVFSSVINVWIWGALNRETREVVAYACGDRSEEVGRILWNRIPPAYKKAVVVNFKVAAESDPSVQVLAVTLPLSPGDGANSKRLN